MPRPEKNTAEYFSHDAFESSTRIPSILFNHYGHEGISCWWQLKETLCGVEDHYLDIRMREDLEFRAAEVRLSPERYQEILTKMAEMNAIDAKLFQYGVVWCQELVNRLASVYKRRKKPLPSKPVFLLTETELLSTETPLPSTENPQSTVKESTVEKKDTKKDKPDQKTLDLYFSQFWAAYPKKRSKGQAEKTFMKLKPDEQLMSTILAAIERAKKSDPQWKKNGGQFILYPATWLNARGWEDEVSNNGSGGSNRGSRALPDAASYTDPDDL